MKTNTITRTIDFTVVEGAIIDLSNYEVKTFTNDFLGDITQSKKLESIVQSFLNENSGSDERYKLVEIKNTYVIQRKYEISMEDFIKYASEC